MAPVPLLRIATLNDQSPNSDGEFVLYWMTAFRRVNWNFPLQRAVELAKQSGAAIHIVHAYRFPVDVDAPYEVSLPEDYLEAVRQVVHRKLEAVAEKVAAEDLKVEWHLVSVPEASAIANLAEEVGADLIVMGTRGNTGLKHVLLGSVAERTIRLSPCSVLTVKTNAD